MKSASCTASRTPVRGALALLVAAAFAVLTIAPAQAAAYRYWGFYQLTGSTWTFAQKGPDQITPADGSVEGWRFAVGDESSSRLPRATATFDRLCSGTPAQSGKKRIGVVLDYGRPADSADDASPPQPKGVCAVVPTDASSTDALRSAGTLRMEKGLVCAIDDYPATDCGSEVKTVSDAAKAPDASVTLSLPAPAASSGAASAPTTPAGESPSVSAGASPPGSTVTPTPDASTPAASPDGSATTAPSSSNVGTTIAYVVAALALIALIAFLVVRARAARQTSG